MTGPQNLFRSTITSRVQCVALCVQCVASCVQCVASHVLWLLIPSQVQEEVDIPKELVKDLPKSTSPVGPVHVCSFYHVSRPSSITCCEHHGLFDHYLSFA